MSIIKSAQLAVLPPESAHKAQARLFRLVYHANQINIHLMNDDWDSMFEHAVKAVTFSEEIIIIGRIGIQPDDDYGIERKDIVSMFHKQISKTGQTMQTALIIALSISVLIGQRARTIESIYERARPSTDNQPETMQ